MKRWLLAAALWLAPLAAFAQGFGPQNPIPLTSIVSGSAEASHVLKAAPGNLLDVYFANTTGGANGFLVVLNATSAPVDGAITPIECVYVPSGQLGGLTFQNFAPEVYSTGITAVFTTAATCFTKTTGVATGFFHARVQ